MTKFNGLQSVFLGRFENLTPYIQEMRLIKSTDEINKMLALKKKLVARLQSVLGLGVDVRLVEPRSIERSVGKAKRVIDNRKL